MKILIYISTVFLISCQAKKDNLFEALQQEADVEIYLSEYELQEIPSDIGILKKARRLYINSDTVGGWTIYPPLSVFEEERINPPFRHIPEEMTELTDLQSLSLVNLDLVTLPDNIDRLEQLDTLILFRNKLTIAKEIEKLKRLTNLKYLGILGNVVTANDIIDLKRSNPDLEINPDVR